MTDAKKNAQARALCEKNLWSEVLTFALKWQTENPADAKSFFYQGVALAALGKFTEAEKNYRCALELDPQDFKTWNNLAGILFDTLERPVDAIRCIEAALKIEPANKLAWANLASMVGQLGRHDDALKCAERALAIDPQMVEAQLHKARAALALGKREMLRAASEALSKLPLEKFQRTR
jgi:tetratricopeptide (TPR) repeat protein